MTIATNRRRMTGRLLRALAEAWADRSPRERRLLRIAAVFVAAALSWLLAFGPLLEAHTRLEQTLPGLRAAAAEIDELARALRNADLPAPAATSALRADALSTSLAAHDLVASDIRNADGRWTLEFHTASLPALLGWTRAVERSMGLRVVSAQLERDSAPGMVSAVLVLAAGPN